MSRGKHSVMDPATKWAMPERPKLAADEARRAEGEVIGEVVVLPPTN